MKQPGDNGRQAIDIEQLETDPDTTIEEAVEIATELGADPAYYVPAEETDHDSDVHELDSDFFINAIDFRKYDLFRIQNYDGFEGKANDEVNAVHMVTKTNQWSRGLEISHPEFQEGVNDGWASTAIDEIPFPTGLELFHLWLQGNLTPVKQETTYIDRESGEEVEV